MFRTLGPLATVLLLGGCLQLQGGPVGYRAPPVTLPGGGAVYGVPYPAAAPSTRRWVGEEPRVVCDRETEVCYKRGRIDSSETRDAFGKGPARRVRALQQEFGSNDVFLPRDNTVCDRNAEVCYKNGRPDWSDTRDQFGKKAARRLRD